MGINIKSSLSIDPSVCMYLNANDIIINKSSSFVYLKVPRGIEISKKGKILHIVPLMKRTNASIRAFFVRFKRLLKGVAYPACKHMHLKGVGYKVSFNQENKILCFKLGFSHTVDVKVPFFINVEIKKGNKLNLTSPLYSELLDFSSSLTRLRKKDPYKGKGVVFLNKKLILKQGKRQ